MNFPKVCDSHKCDNWIQCDKPEPDFRDDSSLDPVNSHYSDVTMNSMASQITSHWNLCSAVCSGSHQIKHQSSASLAFVRVIHRWPVDSLHKEPAVRNVFIGWRHDEPAELRLPWLPPATNCCCYYPCTRVISNFVLYLIILDSILSKNKLIITTTATTTFTITVAAHVAPAAAAAATLAVETTPATVITTTTTAITTITNPPENFIGHPQMHSMNSFTVSVELFMPSYAIPRHRSRSPFSTVSVCIYAWHADRTAWNRFATTECLIILFYHRS